MDWKPEMLAIDSHLALMFFTKSRHRLEQLLHQPKAPSAVP
jgi:hypothetical protein